jgi:hypothetical protein
MAILSDYARLAAACPNCKCNSRGLAFATFTDVDL